MEEAIDGFQEFVKEIGRHVSKRGIITLSSERSTQRWDVGKGKDGTLVFGTIGAQSLFFPIMFRRTVSEANGVGLILRTFTAEKDESTGLPVKELRGYLIYLGHDGKLRYRQSTAREVAEASTTHYATGKFLAPERGVVYCGPDDDYLDDNLNPITR